MNCTKHTHTHIFGIAKKTNQPAGLWTHSPITHNNTSHFIVHTHDRDALISVCFWCRIWVRHLKFDRKSSSRRITLSVLFHNSCAFFVHDPKSQRAKYQLCLLAQSPSFTSAKKLCVTNNWQKKKINRQQPLICSI